MRGAHGLQVNEPIGMQMKAAPVQTEGEDEKQSAPFVMNKSALRDDTAHGKRNRFNEITQVAK